MNTNTPTKQERIVKIFTGRYIDLSSIISIGDAKYDRESKFIGFGITCKLLEKPIYFYREINRDTEEEKIEKITPAGGIHGKKEGETFIYFGYKMTDGRVLAENWYGHFRENFLYATDYPNILAVHNLQNQIDEIILMWKNYLSQNPNQN